MSHSKEWATMCAGEPYFAGDADLQANRIRCNRACRAFNALGMEASRRDKVQAWRTIIDDKRPMPPLLADPEADAAQFDATDPVVDGPVTVDHGQNLLVEPGTFLNFNLVVLDTCPVKIGARTLLGPNVSIYTALHSVDPAVRNGMLGPEYGQPVTIGDDCWIAGGVTILAGVTIGRGCTIGAASVVTRDIPDYSVAVGSPARVVKTVKPIESTAL